MKIIYIHDVIANLRAKDLELLREIQALQHALRMLEAYYPVPKDRNVSRETNAVEGDGNGSAAQEKLL